jgi:hypothetical protein
MTFFLVYLLFAFTLLLLNANSLDSETALEFQLMIEDLNTAEKSIESFKSKNEEVSKFYEEWSEIYSDIQLMTENMITAGNYPKIYRTRSANSQNDHSFRQFIFASFIFAIIATICVTAYESWRDRRMMELIELAPDLEDEDETGYLIELALDLEDEDETGYGVEFISTPKICNHTYWSVPSHFIFFFCYC